MATTNTTTKTTKARATRADAVATDATKARKIAEPPVAGILKRYGLDVSLAGTSGGARALQERKEKIDNERKLTDAERTDRERLASKLGPQTLERYGISPRLAGTTIGLDLLDEARKVESKAGAAAKRKTKKDDADAERLKRVEKAGSPADEIVPLGQEAMDKAAARTESYPMFEHVVNFVREFVPVGQPLINIAKLEDWLKDRTEITGGITAVRKGKDVVHMAVSILAPPHLRENDKSSFLTQVRQISRAFLRRQSTLNEKIKDWLTDKKDDEAGLFGLGGWEKGLKAAEIDGDKAKSKSGGGKGKGKEDNEPIKTEAEKGARKPHPVLTALLHKLGPDNTEDERDEALGEMHRIAGEHWERLTICCNPESKVDGGEEDE